MIIGLLTIDIHLPYSHSLKEKRKRLLSFRDRLKKKYNVAFAELEYQDKWQRTRIGMVTLNSQKAVIEKMFQRITIEIEEKVEGEILRQDIEYF
jgi:uncharacterized protein YlxP (DUF503 family)